MTRINVVEPCQLIDKHLMAEYRELPRIFTTIKLREEKGKAVSPNEIPEYYVLGKGHVKFFYDKLAYLRIRYERIFNELIARGFQLDKELFNKVMRSTYMIKQKDLFKNHWEPAPEEIYLNMARLAKRCKIDEVEEELKSG